MHAAVERRMAVRKIYRRSLPEIAQRRFGISSRAATSPCMAGLKELPWLQRGS